MSRTSLPVASPSSAGLETKHDETTKASASPSAATQRVSGSNSKRLPYGDCRNCNSSWPLDAEGLVPHHADPDSPRGWTRPTCPGSRQPTSVVAEA